jgi:hypothetical protein
MDQLLSKINKLKNWQAIVVIVVIGIAVYSVGLTNPFQGDDNSQIVSNVPVHSLSNIKLFFEGSTFYAGKGLSPLWGVYYKPLMTTVYSLIYSLFGPHPIYYHLVQLALCIGSTILLYLFFRFSFKPVLALILALIFLVHPIDSQVVYAIPSMQDALFFFFGILGLYLLVKYSKPTKANKDWSIKILPIVALCMLLSLLSKETGILFVLMSLMYLWIFDNRRRLYSYAGIVALPVIIWLVLRVNAVGLGRNPHADLIDKVSLTGRLMNMPSIIQFYLAKFVWPLKLSTDYNWVNSTFSIKHVLLPLFVSILTLGLIIYTGLQVHKKASKAQFYSYIFFFIWLCLGVAACLQIIPLDSTASEPWFYFPIAGLLGMIGIMLGTVVQVRAKSLVIISVIVLALFGVRTVNRGLDWRSEYTLASSDIASSSDDWQAYSELSAYYIQQNDFTKAAADAKISVDMYPTSSNYYNLGASLRDSGQFSMAVPALKQSLAYGYQDKNAIYNDLAELTLVTGSFNYNQRYLINALTQSPHNSYLWFYLAILEDRYSSNKYAINAIDQAAMYGPVPKDIYENILNNEPFSLNLGGDSGIINVP